MSALRPPFVARVLHADRELARRVAAALAEALAARGVSVRLDGTKISEGATHAEVDAGFSGPERSVPLLEAGVRGEDGAARFVPPIPLARDAEAAARRAVGFLERWGFVPVTPEPRAPLNAASASAPASVTGGARRRAA